MTLLSLIRHGTTGWNETGRIQGRTDIALSVAGRAEVARWQIPPELVGARWFTSPLMRAVQTARIMGITRLSYEPRLIEMDWSEWEGRSLDELRACDPQGMNDIEARGLDFKAPGGESPRDVQIRLTPWLAEITRDPAPAVAVTHKGVVRALYAMASGWNMLGPPPAKLNWSSAHVLRLSPGRAPNVERLNLSLMASKDRRR